MEAYVTDDLVQQEIVKLAEDKEDAVDDVVPHRSDLVQYGEDDVCH
jgi:hypothetical protein